MLKIAPPSESSATIQDIGEAQPTRTFEPRQPLAGQSIARQLRQAILPGKRRSSASSIAGEIFRGRFSPPGSPPGDDPLPEAVRSAREELQALQTKTARLREEVGELEESKHNKAAEFDAMEQLLADETRKIRDELMRDQSSLAMETTLLREQRHRMEIRARALNAQRREIEDLERQVAQRDTLQQAEQEWVEREKIKAQVQFAKLAEQENQFQTRLATLEAQANFLQTQKREWEAQKTQLERSRQAFEAEQKNSQDLITARESEQARREAELQKIEEETRNRAAALAQKSQNLEHVLADLDRRRDLLSSLVSEQQKVQEDLIKERDQLTAGREKLQQQNEKFQKQTRAFQQARDDFAKQRTQWELHREALIQTQTQILAEISEKESSLAERTAALEAEHHALRDRERLLRSRQIDLQNRAQKIRIDRDLMDDERATLRELQFQARTMEGYGRLAEEHCEELIERLTEREVQLNGLLLDLEAIREAETEEASQQALDQQQAILGIAMEEMAAMKLQIQQLLAEQSITNKERHVFNQARRKLREDQLQLLQKQQELESTREQLHSAEAKYQTLLQEQRALEQTRRSLTQREAELKAGLKAWEREKEALEHQKAQANSAALDLQSEREALNEEFHKLAAMKKEQEAANEQLHQQQWEMTSHRAKLQKRAAELNDWEQKLKAEEQQRKVQLEQLAEQMAQMEAQKKLAQETEASQSPAAEIRDIPSPGVSSPSEGRQESVAAADLPASSRVLRELQNEAKERSARPNPHAPDHEPIPDILKGNASPERPAAAQKSGKKRGKGFLPKSALAVASVGLAGAVLTGLLDASFRPAIYGGVALLLGAYLGNEFFKTIKTLMSLNAKKTQDPFFLEDDQLLP